MREQIYYWKCDSPQCVEDKKAVFFKEKYACAALTDTVQETCRRVFHTDDPVSVEPLDCDGNHLAYVLTHNGRQYLFRADDGSGEDDYLLAESAVMQRARDQGLPVPQVVATDVSCLHSPLRYQVMEYVPNPNLNAHYKAGRLDVPAIGQQIGAILRRLHGVELPGFGFIDTEHLRCTGHLRGLDADYPRYFYKCLDDHLGYLERFELLRAAECKAITHCFTRHAALLDRPTGVLVHRDMALWNLLGTPERITAVIDWDDAVSGDPADDLGILGCFHDEPFMQAVWEGYWGGETFPVDFRLRVRLHTLRNMLWKTKIRHLLGYFEKDASFFLNTPDVYRSLKAHTLAILRGALADIENTKGT